LIKILIVDDHQMIVDGLKSVLMADPALRVVGSAPSLSRGLSLIEEHDPDVIILDIRLSDVSGVTVVERARSLSSRAVIIVLTGFGLTLREDSLRAGADVFLSKETASDVIVRTIRQSVAVHDPTWTSKEALSPREREIAALAAGGKSNPEIAGLLGVSINTVKTHLSHVMAKMGVGGRVALALEWKRRLD
jgi:DNA-binding NarL/FixJ family response regulator